MVIQNESGNLLLKKVCDILINLKLYDEDSDRYESY
jgi:hypothetical protein